MGVGLFVCFLVVFVPFPVCNNNQKKKKSSILRLKALGDQSRHNITHMQFDMKISMQLTNNVLVSAG